MPVLLNFGVTSSAQLDHSVVHIAHIAEHTVSGSEQITMASSELARLGENLLTLVSQFKT